MQSELQDKCNLDDCSGYVCEFHSLRPSAQEYITVLEAQMVTLREIAQLARYFLNGNWDFKDGSDAYDRHEMLIDALDAWESFDA